MSDEDTGVSKANPSELQHFVDTVEGYGTSFDLTIDDLETEWNTVAAGNDYAPAINPIEQCRVVVGIWRRRREFVSNVREAFIEADGYDPNTPDAIYTVDSAAITAVLEEKAEELEEMFDDFEQALVDEGLSAEEAERLRIEFEFTYSVDPEFEVDGETLSNPEDFAAALRRQSEQAAQEIVDDNTSTSGGHNRRTTVSTRGIAIDLTHGDLSPEIVSLEWLDEDLQAGLTDDQYQSLRENLAEQRLYVSGANASLVDDAGDDILLAFDAEELEAEAQDLYEGHLEVRTGRNSQSANLDEVGLTYRLQQIAEEDPERALALKLFLEEKMTASERSELNRLLATNGRFGEAITLAIENPVDGVEGAAKGIWNETGGALLEGWSDIVVAGTYGFWGMGTGQQVPTTYEEIDAVHEFQLEMDNIAQQGGDDLRILAELVGAGYSGGRAGYAVVRIGGRYFIRSGGRTIARISDGLAARLQRRSGLNQPLGRGSTVNPSRGRYHPRTLREELAIDEAMQNPANGEGAAGPMGDSRWPAEDGWQKMQQTVNPGGGEGPITIHYNYNPKTGQVDDFKVVKRKPYVPNPEPPEDSKSGD